MATKTTKPKTTKAGSKSKAATQEIKVAPQPEIESLENIRKYANMAWTQHHNKNWMLQEIAKNNPGLVYYWNPTNLGHKLNKAATSVNKLLENMGFQERKGKVWVLTSKGEKYAVLRPFEVKHPGVEYPVNGLQILWSIDVIPLIRAWLKGPEKKTPKPATPMFDAEMDEQQLLDQLLLVTEKTITDEFNTNAFVDMELEQAKELAARLYGKLRCHWKAVTCYAQARKQGCVISIKVLAPKPEGSSDRPKTPAATVATVAKFTPADGLSSQQLVEELLKAIDKTPTEEFSVPVPVDLELEQAQELAAKLYKGLLKHWKVVTCYARPRKAGATIQVKVQACQFEQAS